MATTGIIGVLTGCRFRIDGLGFRVWGLEIMEETMETTMNVGVTYGLGFRI